MRDYQVNESANVVAQRLDHIVRIYDDEHGRLKVARTESARLAAAVDDFLRDSHYPQDGDAPHALKAALYFFRQQEAGNFRPVADVLPTQRGH